MCYKLSVLPELHRIQNNQRLIHTLRAKYPSCTGDAREDFLGETRNGIIAELITDPIDTATLHYGELVLVHWT